MREQNEATPGLTQEQRAKFFEKYMKLKEVYANSQNDTKGNEKKAEITQQIQKDKSDTDRHIQLKDYIADVVLDENVAGNIFDKFGEQQSLLLASIVNGTIELDSEKNTPGYYGFDGKFYSIEEIQDIVDSNKRDEASAAGVKALVENVERQAANVKEGDSYDFDYQREYNNVLNKIVETGNLNSLSKDEIFGNRVFEDDLKNVIGNETYASVGVDTGEESPFTKTDNIIEDDVNMIAANIMQDQATHQKYLAEYFTNAMAQNWHHNLPMEIKNIIINNNKKSNDESSAKFNGDIEKNGGVVRNGIFIPNKTV
tara:strand:- start:612 stop:1550 length:939 start_codon:yes stop_codon:yes gene_type:complete